MLAENRRDWTREWREQGRAEGREEGLSEGLKAGVKEGEAHILRRLLSRRFGTIPDWVERRISEAPVEAIEEWSERVLDAETLGQVFDMQPDD